MKRRLVRIFFSLLGVFLVVITFSSLTFKQRTNDRPLPAFYKKGVFHLHSNFSDGRGSITEICRDARDNHLDFVILTDHGRPNLRSSAATAWNQGILLIGASEFSLAAGHLAAAGYRVPDYIFPPEAQEAIDEVDGNGGVTFISHPMDRSIPWTDPQARGFTGIEILSLYQMAKKNLLTGMILLPLRYLFNPGYALTSLITYPRQEMRLWDRCNRTDRCYGIYALDSHAKLQLSKKASLHFPSYGATFRILTVYVKMENGFAKDPSSAAAAVTAALRRGDFFNVIESLAPANGFENGYREKSGRRIAMGGDAQGPGGDMTFKLPFDFATDIVIKKDGEIFKRIRNNTRRELSVPIEQGGVYRAEISLASGRFRKLPWIMANPFFIAMPAPAARPAEAVGATVPAGDVELFRVEKNSRSSAVLQLDKQDKENPVLGLTFRLQPEVPGDPNFWAALANRQKLAASGRRGVVFETRASRPMRFWLQFRSGGSDETAYQHSFLADESWRRVTIPFAGFRRLYGPATAPDLSAIRSLFFLIDNGNAYPGAAGEIFLRRIGLY
ncbi:MAG TPA: hypothetical protein VLQ89_06170 [Candidatus Binatia bacterium]|nr:hypothetical protein [Candidatus Binatia bacterium]